MAPVFAQDFGERIKTIEQELEQLKAQQIELKKEAKAAAALPLFNYRPGIGGDWVDVMLNYRYQF